MDPGAAQAEMVQQDLTWFIICDLAKNQYQSFFENNKWERLNMHMTPISESA
jgi:hypothetical protein